MTEQTFREWTILELMGHRQLAGLLTEVELAGERFLRIDIYDGEDDQAKATQLYRPAAVYCITPTTEEIARAFTRRYWMPPMTRLQLDPPRRPADQMDDYDQDEDEDLGPDLDDPSIF